MKIMIFGRPGSGKSMFASQLSQNINIPVYHLDKYFYTKNWIARDKQEFLELQQKIVNQAHWIIDGNVTKNLEVRYAQANIAIYFLLPRLTCLKLIIKRRFIKNNHLDDRVLNCPEKISLKFLWYMWTFNWRVKKTISSLRKKYPKVKFYLIKSNRDLATLWGKITCPYDQ